MRDPRPSVRRRIDVVDGCEHWFVRVPGWWHRRRADRYRCLECGPVTRGYHSTDAAMGRPVHRSMTVAVLGWNAQR